MKGVCFSWIAFFTIISFSACGLKQDDQDVFVKVEPEFTIGMFEELGDPKVFSFTVQTIEPQPCTNNAIDIEYGQTKKDILINVKDIIEATNCVEGDTIIGTNAVMSPFTNGKISLDLILKNTIKGNGTLTVDDEKYSLMVEDGYGFTVQESILYKIPTGTIWGHVTYANDALTPIAAAFVEDFNKITEPISLHNGYYGHFDIDDNGKLSFPMGNVAGNSLSFLMGMGDAAVEDLALLLSNYRNQYSAQELMVELFLWNGQKL